MSEARWHTMSRKRNRKRKTGQRIFRTNCRQSEKLARQNERAFREQIHVHACEITALHAEMLAYRDGLGRALWLVSAAQRKEWTPADDESLKELRKLIGV